MFKLLSTLLFSLLILSHAEEGEIKHLMVPDAQTEEAPAHSDEELPVIEEKKETDANKEITEEVKNEPEQAETEAPLEESHADEDVAEAKTEVSNTDEIKSEEPKAEEPKVEKVVEEKLSEDEKEVRHAEEAELQELGAGEES